MPKFSNASRAALDSCDPRLKDLFLKVVQHADCSVLCGYRTEEEQNELVRTGHSKLQWPESKHNNFPSQAVDVAPYPIDWNDTNRFYHFAGFVRGMAAERGLELRCGADWDNDFDLGDQTFMDLPHFEIVE